MTGRITDAYTNIATVKLFSHAQREAGVRARRDAGVPAHRARADAAGHRLRDRQPHRSVDGADRRAPPASTLWLWTQGEVGVGAVAAATAMALRLNGISHWVMWEMAALFEHIGTVQDGINTLSRPHAVVDRAGREAARGHARRDPLRARELRLRRQAPRDRRPDAAHPARREDRPRRPLGRRQVDDRQPAAALLRRRARPHPDRRPGHRARRRRTACARRSAW